MNEFPPSTSDEQTSRNIGLAFGLLADVLDDSGVMDNIPDDATLVLLPYGDPKLALSNLATAMSLAGKGQTVYLRRVGAPSDDAAGTATVVPRWPAYWQRQAGLSVTYDLDVVELTLDLSNEAESAIPFPIGERLALLVHPRSQEVVHYVIPEVFFEAPRQGRNDRDDAPATDYALGEGTFDMYASFAKDLARRAA